MTESSIIQIKVNNDPTTSTVTPTIEDKNGIPTITVTSNHYDNTMDASKTDTIVPPTKSNTNDTTTTTTTTTTTSSMKDMLSSVRKASVAMAGGALVAVGIPLIPFPAPGGIVCVGAGLALLGTEFPAAQELLEKSKEKINDFANEKDDDDDNNVNVEQKQSTQSPTSRSDKDDDISDMEKTKDDQIKCIIPTDSTKLAIEDEPSKEEQVIDGIEPNPNNTQIHPSPFIVMNMNPKMSQLLSKQQQSQSPQPQPQTQQPQTTPFSSYQNLYSSASSSFGDGVKVARKSLKSFTKNIIVPIMSHVPSSSSSSSTSVEIKSTNTLDTSITTNSIDVHLSPMNVIDTTGDDIITVTSTGTTNQL